LNGFQRGFFYPQKLGFIIHYNLLWEGVAKFSILDKKIYA
jgi:hypothetical protein